MKTTCSAEQIEDELNELKLRIAQMNARRNAQINLLQKNITDYSKTPKNVRKSNDIRSKTYLQRYPLYRRYPLSLYPRRYWTSIDDLLDRYNEPEDYWFRKSADYLRDKNLPITYKVLERKIQSDLITKLKRFVIQQENDINDELIEKIFNPPNHRLNTTSLKSLHNEDNIRRKFTSKTNKLYSENSENESPFLKPINKSDNFSRRYNSFVKGIFKSFRRTTSPTPKTSNYKSPITLTSSTWKPQITTTPKKYFSSPISDKLLSTKLPSVGLDGLYSKPWYRYFPHYEYFPKSYNSSRDIDTAIGNLKLEHRKPFTYSSYKYDPYESDSYIRSNFPTWKQYYYTQKLKSEPGNERLLDFYDPYRDFFYDAASARSDDLDGLQSTREDYEINSVMSEVDAPDYSFAGSVKNYDKETDDLQIIDEYRDLIYEDIINNLRKQQTRRGRKTRAVLKNDRSLYNYRINEPYSTTRSSYLSNEKFQKPFIRTYTNTYNEPTISDSLKNPSYRKTNFNHNRNYNENNINTPDTKLNAPTTSYITRDLHNHDSVGEYKSPDLEKNNYHLKYNTSPIHERESFIEKPEIDRHSYVNNNKNDGKDGPTVDVTETRPITSFKHEDTNPPSPKPVRKESIVPLSKNVASYDEKSQPPSPSSRRASFLDNHDQLNRFNTSNSNLTSPKNHQSRVSKPSSPTRQLSESPTLSPTAPMSRKNSTQYLSRKESMKTSSIEEEPNEFSRNDEFRKYSKDQIPSYNSDSYLQDPSISANVSVGMNGKSYDEPKDGKIKYDKEIEQIPQPTDYVDKSYTSNAGTQKIQNYDDTNFKDDVKYQDNYSPPNDPAYQTTYNQYSDNEPYYNPRYTTNDYNYSTEPSKDYQNQNYPTRYDDTITESDYKNQPYQYQDSYPPTNQGYYTTPEQTMQSDYERYNDDYAPNPRTTEPDNSLNSNEPYPNQYREPDENYNQYRYQQYSYGNRRSSVLQEDNGNYPPNTTNQKELDRNSYENSDYPNENYIKTDEINTVTEKIPDESKSKSENQKTQDRKKSMSVEQRESLDSTAPEITPKETPLSRRTSKANLSLAERRAANEKRSSTDASKSLKSKPADNKFKRTPSMMKSKSVTKKT